METTSILAQFAAPEIRSAADIFAKRFREEGLFGGDSVGNSTSSRPTTQENKAKRELSKKQTAQKEEMSLLQKRIKSQEKMLSLSKFVGSHKKKEIEAIDENREKLDELTKSYNKSISASENMGGIWKSFKQSMQDTVQSFFSFRSAGAFGVKAAYQGFNDFSAAMKYGTDTSTGIFSNMWNGMSLGMDPAKLSEIQAHTRQAVNVMGGAEEWTNKIAGVQHGLYGYVGGLNESTQFLADSMSTLVRVGINPTTDAFMKIDKETGEKTLGSFGKIFKDIQNLSGATFEESGKLMQEFADDSTIRWKLMGKTTEVGRRKLLQETMARHKNLLAMGMTTEQAKRAAQALDQLAGKGPKDRIKQAAKMRMLMGALGISGGAEMQSMMMKRTHSKGEQEKIAQVVRTVQSAVSSRQQIGIGSDLMVSRLIEGIDLVGANSGIDADTLTDVAASGNKTAKGIGVVAETHPWLVKMSAGIAQVVNNLKENPLLSGILAATAFTGKMAALIAFRMYGGFGFLKKILPFIATGITSAIATVGTGTAAVGTAVAAGGGVGAIVGGLLTAAATGALVLSTLYATVKATGKTWSETTEQSAERVSNLFGGAWFGLGDILNKAYSWFGHYGDSLLELFVSKEKVKGWGDSLGKIAYDTFGVNDTDRATSWAQEARVMNKLMPPEMAEKQTMLNEAFTNLAKNGTSLYKDSEAANPQLNEISTLLREMNLTNAHVSLLTKTQVESLAKIASDGEVTKNETAELKKITKNVKGRSPSPFFGG